MSQFVKMSQLAPDQHFDVINMSFTMGLGPDDECLNQANFAPEIVCIDIEDDDDDDDDDDGNDDDDDY